MANTLPSTPHSFGEYCVPRVCKVANSNVHVSLGGDLLNAKVGDYEFKSS
jgi:hypothetical protein